MYWHPKRRISVQGLYKESIQNCTTTYTHAQVGHGPIDQIFRSIRLYVFRRSKPNHTYAIPDWFGRIRKDKSINMWRREKQEEEKNTKKRGKGWGDKRTEK